LKDSSIGYAIQRFNELRSELEDVSAELGLPPLLCFVRQKKNHTDVDNGWAFFEIDLKPGRRNEAEIFNELVFIGKMREVRPDGQEKVVEIVIDPETIASIEFELFESPEVAS
jgi:hypothetical protein